MKTFLFTFAIVALAGCTSKGGGGGSTPGSSPPVNSENVPQTVRDYIEIEYGSPERRAAALRLASAFQSAVDQPEKALEILPLYLKAKACAASLEGGVDSREIEKRIVNSFERARAYAKYNSLISGQIILVPSADAKACD